MALVQKILITGASGYIGSRLSLYLAERGHKVIAVCYPNLPENKGWINNMYKVIVGDVSVQGFIDELKKEEIDAIIHLVSLDHNESEKNNEVVFNVNVKPLLLLLEAFKNTLTHKVIYFSTIQVYGKNLRNIVKETQLPSPVNKYGLTHYLCENVMNYYNTQLMSCVNIRLSNSYGEPVFADCNCWKLVINDLCKMAFEKKEIKLLSDGSPLRDFIHFKDICQAIEILILQNNHYLKENTINISSGETYAILELAKIVQDVYHDRFELLVPIYFADGRKFDETQELDYTDKYIIDNTRLLNQGIKPKTDLRTGINELFDYLELLYDRNE